MHGAEWRSSICNPTHFVEDRVLVGPKSGARTTAPVRDATNCNQIVSDFGLPDLIRRGLRQTGAP
jgi:hypothetical protein